MTPKFIRLMQEMADHTAPECAKTCRIPHSCCDAMYCDIAEEWSRMNGVTLEPLTHHPTLKFMGPNGCTVPPHLRPHCTLHTCEIGAWAIKRGDPEWTQKYYALREQIERESDI